MEGIYIDDGYTETATISRIEGLRPEVKVRYRLASAAERNRYIMAGDPEKLTRIQGALIVQYVVELNGKEKPFANTDVTKLNPNLVGPLCDLILGYTQGDPDDAKN